MPLRQEARPGPRRLRTRRSRRLLAAPRGRGLDLGTLLPLVERRDRDRVGIRADRSAPHAVVGDAVPAPFHARIAGRAARVVARAHRGRAEQVTRVSLGAEPRELPGGPGDDVVGVEAAEVSGDRLADERRLGVHRHAVRLQRVVEPAPNRRAEGRRPGRCRTFGSRASRGGRCRRRHSPPSARGTARCGRRRRCRGPEPRESRPEAAGPRSSPTPTTTPRSDRCQPAGSPASGRRARRGRRTSTRRAPGSRPRRCRSAANARPGPSARTSRRRGWSRTRGSRTPRRTMLRGAGPGWSGPERGRNRAGGGESERTDDGVPHPGAQIIPLFRE